MHPDSPSVSLDLADYTCPVQLPPGTTSPMVGSAWGMSWSGSSN
ncbi:hypothetical protein [Pseudomonas sp. CAM1A]